MWLPALAPTRQRLGEGGRWSTSLWAYAVFAVVIYSRAAADRLGVTVGEIAQRTHGDTGSSSWRHRRLPGVTAGRHPATPGGSPSTGGGTSRGRRPGARGQTGLPRGRHSQNAGPRLLGPFAGSWPARGGKYFARSA